MNEALLERVKNYCSGQMNLEDQERFEQDLTTNTELAALLELYRTIENGIEESTYPEEEALLRASLETLHKEFLAGERQIEVSTMQAGEQYSSVTTAARHLPETRKDRLRQLNPWKSVAVAAFIIGIIAMGSLLYFQKENHPSEVALHNETSGQPDRPVQLDTNLKGTHRPAGTGAIRPEGEPTPSKQDHKGPTVLPTLTAAAQKALYTESFQKDSLPSDYSDLLQEAFHRYQNGEYQDAIASIDIEALQVALEEQRPRGQQVAQQEEQRTLFYAHYYRALSYMMEQKEGKAISEWHRALAGSPDRYWRGKAQWYLALAHLKMGHLRETRQSLKQVAANGHAPAVQEKAVQLLKKLDEHPLE